jgi:hypothetical protein
MFPVPFPICGGTDNDFGQKLRDRYQGVFDKSIVMYHIAPRSLGEFWHQQVNRGKGSVHTNFFLKQFSITKLFSRSLVKGIIAVARIALVLPNIVRSFMLLDFSQRRLKDLIPFWIAFSVMDMARTFGEFVGCFEIARYAMRQDR